MLSQQQVQVPTKQIQKSKRGRKPLSDLVKEQRKLEKQFSKLPKQKKKLSSLSSQLDNNESHSTQADEILIESEDSQEIALQKQYKGVSIPKYLRHPEEFQFLDVPIIVPTIEELRDPFRLVRRLHKEGYMKHGVVKIVPKKDEWNPEYIFDKNQKMMTTRIQNVKDLSQGLAFEQNIDEYTYEKFKKSAKDFDNEYKYQTKMDITDFYRKNEYEYFSVLENPDKFKDIEVEYAADLPSSKFGSAFPEDEQLHKNEHSWNLKHINKQKNSLFQFIGISKNKEVSGITSPWIYLAMKFATFCFHTEDLWMYALNYMHQGEKKTWYTIPPAFRTKFEEVYRAKYNHIFKNKPDIMYRLNLQLCPVEATRAYVPIYRTDQAPGEFMMTFPKVYHGGFSHGFNCGEAVNIASTEWLKFYREAVDDYALKGHYKKVSFPIQWMMIQIIENLPESEFDNIALQQIKEEYEYYVKLEIQQRSNIIQTYGNKLLIHEYDNKKVKYDRMICKSCQSYMFFSYLYCNKCLKSSCTSHVSTCSCMNNKVSLFYRYSDNELQDFIKQIDNEMEKNNQKDIEQNNENKI